MMKSINLCFEEAETQRMYCSKCTQPILSLHQATSFLKIANPNPKHYFVFEPTNEEQQNNSNAYVVDENSIYTEVRDCFFLMEAAKVQCGVCRLQIGVYIVQASEKEQEWLVNSILFDTDTLDFSPKQLKEELINKLVEEMKEQEQEVQAQKKASIAEEQFNYTEIVKEALSNIVFYSGVIDELKGRFQDYMTLKKYQIVKSKAKPRQRENS